MSLSSTMPSTTARRERFEAVAREAERAMAASLPGYRMKVALLAMLGYGVIFGMLSLLLGISAVCVWAMVSGYAWVLLLKTKLILAMPACGLVLLRALWVRIEAPKGYEVFPKDCPRLFGELASLCRGLKAPRIHRVLIMNDFNVSIMQIPRLGIFGWHCNYLILGLPVFLTLTKEQARAVLAHEIGHLSSNHSRFGAWIYRVRLSWLRVVMALEHDEGWGRKFLTGFFAWYAPYFGAYSFALARANEYEADAAAAAVISPGAVGAALVAFSTLSTVDREQFWDPLFKRADSDPQVPHTPWSDFSRYAKQRQIDRAHYDGILARVTAIETTYADTHPSLCDRLKALHTNGKLEDAEGPPVADEWLAPALESILADFDRQWREDHETVWQQRFAHVQTMKRLLLELESKALSELTQKEG